jgi:hypothetical protein
VLEEKPTAAPPWLSRLKATLWSWQPLGRRLLRCVARSTQPFEADLLDWSQQLPEWHRRPVIEALVVCLTRCWSWLRFKRPSRNTQGSKQSSTATDLQVTGATVSVATSS